MCDKAFSFFFFQNLEFDGSDNKNGARSPEKEALIDFSLPPQKPQREGARRSLHANDFSLSLSLLPKPSSTVELRYMHSSKAAKHGGMF